MPASAMPCPSEEDLARLVDQRLSAGARAVVEVHLAACVACRAVVEALDVGSTVESVDFRPRAGAPAAGALHQVDPANYEVKREIARGGMGRILEAWDRRHGRRVAVKVLLRSEAGATARFAREARITARLQHPSIVPLLEAGLWSEGEPFFSMKLVEGRSLAEAVAGCASLADRLRLLPHLVACAEALAYAHTQRVIHRDLKPANVLVGAFGETVVIDWGLAKALDDPESKADDPRAAADATSELLTRAGRVLGTPSYMPPEQARGDTIDERADVYALGALLYHLLAGGPPYEGTSSKEILDRVLVAAPPPLASRAVGVAPDLAAVVERAMARDAAQRYPTAREMAEDLRRFSEGRLVSVHTYSLGTLARRWIARHRAAVVVAGAMLVVLAVTATLSVARIVRERDRADTLKQAADEQRTVADSQRALAVTQRDAAERLVEYVVGKLKDRLAPLGRLDVLAGVGEEVEKYYATLEPVGESLVAESLVRRAAALETLALVEERKRAFDVAIHLLDAAIAMRDRVSELHANDVDSSANALEDMARVAFALDQQGKREDALRRMTAASTRGRELAAREPHKPHLDAVRVRVEIDRCNALIYVPDGPGAREACDLARATAIRAVRDAPEDTEVSKALGSAQNQSGTWELHFGTRVSAVAAYRAARETFAALATRDPSQTDWQRSLANADSRLGEAELRSGRLGAAMEAFKQSLDIRDALARRDPENLDRQRELMIAYNGMGAGLSASGKGLAARDAYGRALAIAKTLAEKRPGNVQSEDDLGFAWRNVGAASVDLSKLEEALLAYSEAVRVTSAMVLADPSNRRARYTLGQSVRGHMHAAHMSKKLDAAHAGFVRGQGLFESLLAETTGDLLYERSAAELLLDGVAVERDRGDVGGAEAVARRSLATFRRLYGPNKTDTELAEDTARAAHELSRVLVETRVVDRQSLLEEARGILTPLRAASLLTPSQVELLKRIERDAAAIRR